MSTTNRIAPVVKIHAPFYVNHRWIWETFEAETSNTHAACMDRAKVLGATAWDPSQASVKIGGDVVSGHPTVF